MISPDVVPEVTPRIGLQSAAYMQKTEQWDSGSDSDSNESDDQDLIM